MISFLLWLILLVLCWPLAILALILYPLVWLLLLPFRIVGIAVGGVFELLRGIITLPARVLRVLGTLDPNLTCSRETDAVQNHNSWRGFAFERPYEGSGSPVTARSTSCNVGKTARTLCTLVAASRA